MSNSLHLSVCLDLSELSNSISRAAADVLYEILTIMVKKGPLSVGPSHEL